MIAYTILIQRTVFLRLSNDTRCAMHHTPYSYTTLLQVKRGFKFKNRDNWGLNSSIVSRRVMPLLSAQDGTGEFGELCHC